jgi:hypothetical protein
MVFYPPKRIVFQAGFRIVRLYYNGKIAVASLKRNNMIFTIINNLFRIPYSNTAELYRLYCLQNTSSHVFAEMIKNNESKYCALWEIQRNISDGLRDDSAVVYSSIKRTPIRFDY